MFYVFLARQVDEAPVQLARLRHPLRHVASPEAIEFRLLGAGGDERGGGGGHGRHVKGHGAPAQITYGYAPVQRTLCMTLDEVQRICALLQPT